MNTGDYTLLQVTLVELAHAADAKLIVLTFEVEGPVRGRIKGDVSDRRTQAVVGKVEIDERAAHEDSGGMDLLVERVFAIDEENVNAVPGEQASALQSGESGADDSDVIACFHETYPPSPLSGKVRTGKSLRFVRGSRQVLYGVKKAS